MSIVDVDGWSWIFGDLVLYKILMFILICWRIGNKIFVVIISCMCILVIKWVMFWVRS